MANKVLQIALLLTAVDDMSKVVQQATSNVDKAMTQIKNGYKGIAQGVAGVMSGKLLYDNTVAPMQSAFSQIQNHATDLRIAMMQDGGIINEKYFGQLSKKALKMSEDFGVSRASYLDMFKVLKSNHVSEQDMVGTLGTNMAKWALLMEANPVAGTKFISGLKNDLNLTTDELTKIMDLTQRLHFNEGVGSTGEEAIDQLKEAFSVASLGMTNLKYTGFEAARDFSAMMVPFLRRQLAPETIGTGFRKIAANLLDTKKLQEFNEEAAKFGKSFKFFDDKGNFISWANFMGQMDNFKGMSMPDVSTILQPLVGGKSGMFGDIAKVLAQEGSKGFNEGLKHIYSGGSFDDRFKERMKQLSIQQDRLNEKWNNLKVIVGEQLVPRLLKMFDVFDKIVTHLQNFTRAHPGIVKFVFTFIGLASAMMMAAGALKVLKGGFSILVGSVRLLSSGFLSLFARGGMIRAIFEILIPLVYDLGVALLTTPVGWIILGIVALIALFTDAGGITTWLGEKFKQFGKWLGEVWDICWKATKDFFSGLYELFMQYSLYGLLIRNWGAIVGWVHNMLSNIKGKFMQFVHWIFDLNTRFRQAGINIVMSIYSGIKSMATKPIEAIKAMVQKIRNLLPFSPAKEGPLRDIHRIRLVETIAEGMKPNAMLEKMHDIAGAVYNYSPVGVASSYGPAMAPSSGMNIHITFAPVYHSNGNSFSGEKTQFMEQAKANATQLVRMIADEMERRSYRSFS